MQQQQQQQQTCSPSPSADAFRVPHAAAGASCSIFHAIKPTTSAQSLPPLPLPPTSAVMPAHKRETKLFFSPFIPQTMQRARLGIKTPPFNPTAPKAFPAQLCVCAACTPRGSLRQRGIVGKRGGPVLARGLKRDGGVPLRELISCWMDLPHSMLAVLLLMTPRGSDGQFWAVARSARRQNNGAEGCETSLRLLQPLSIPPSPSLTLLPQELAA